MKIYKRVVLMLMVLLMLVAPLSAFASTYVANRRSGVFHYQGCRYEQQMSESNKAYYNDRDECVSDGYRPCRVCRP